jgi:glycerol-3-phosphate dehydrogenase
MPDVWESDVIHACEYEMATSVSDFMRRRTLLALSRFGDASVAGQVAQLMAPLRGWSAAEQAAQVAGYLAERKAGTL